MKKQNNQSLQNMMAEYQAVTGSNVMQQLEQLAAPLKGARKYSTSSSRSNKH
jgi:hypothetical protein